MPKDHKMFLDREDMPERIKAGRRCKLKGCRTILSSYNLNKYCLAHRGASIRENSKEMEKKAYRKHKLQRNYIEKKKAERQAAREAAKERVQWIS